MSKVVLAEHAGFCFGVQRAVDKAYESSSQDRVYTYGSLIHNDEVMKELNSKGIIKIDDIKKFAVLDKGTVIIRSHGVPRKEEDYIRKFGHKIIDTTCPYVKKIHKLVDKYSKVGYIIIIFGNSKHPEIKGIVGWCNNEPIILENVEDAEKFEFDCEKKGIIVSQTTFNLVKFSTMVEIINEKKYNISVLDTICNATEERQIATENLAKLSDAMIVIGDAKSSNTQKLYDISSNECKETYFIQTASDMDFEKLVGKKLVGVTAGASTPKNIIEEVIGKCQKILDKC